MHRHFILLLLCAHASMKRSWLTVLGLRAVSRHQLHHSMTQQAVHLAGA